MPSTLNPACPLCGLRFGNNPLLDLHIREDHRRYVVRAQDGHRDPGSTRVAAPPADDPPRGHELAFTPARTTKEATGRTARHRRRASRAVTALRQALRAVRHGSGELLRAPGAVIRFARARQARPQAPVPQLGGSGKPEIVPPRDALTATIASFAGPVSLFDDCVRPVRSESAAGSVQD